MMCCDVYTRLVVHYFLESVMPRPEGCENLFGIQFLTENPRVLINTYAKIYFCNFHLIIKLRPLYKIRWTTFSDQFCGISSISEEMLKICTVKWERRSKYFYSLKIHTHVYPYTPTQHQSSIHNSHPMLFLFLFVRCVWLCVI